MRVLANWGGARIPSFPDVPTFKELGFPDVEFYIWAGLFGPRNLPAAGRGAARGRHAPGHGERRGTAHLRTAGSPPAYQDDADFARFVEADSARLIAAVRKIGKVE